MSKAGDELRLRVEREDTFTLDEIRALIAAPDDLDLWAAVYTALGEGYYRIEPEPGMELTCSFILSYLLRCVREDPNSDEIHSAFDAASDLATALKLWATRLPAAEPMLRLASEQVAETFLAGNEAVRARLRDAMLEHALERSAVRPFFAAWEGHPVLGDAWRDAMEWAVHHGDA